ncbi:hypothetical protein F0344_08010 [Streptomyces finlayi]|uniref:MarR family transcriptional regulator n=1 Tax=Streptomyces finlayi TaxID=67296 RepID=A0A7G7BGU8_9ACTN|nr:hypothetical protein [Streptomyces finlayi]QNE74563.1 hypothetical protein F0344_08010 [Streptomyces finlayi]
MSATQYTALQAAARGHVRVTEMLGKQYVHNRDGGMTISTIRSLEAKGLLQREPLPASFAGSDHRARLHLTSHGVTALARAYGRPHPAAPDTRVAPKPALGSTAVRTR